MRRSTGARPHRRTATVRVPPRRVPRTASLLHVAPPDADRAEGNADDRDGNAGRNPGRIPDADHRLAEVRRERELVDPIGQLERRHEQIDDVSHDHEDGRDLGRDGCTPQTADGDADTENRGKP